MEQSWLIGTSLCTDGRPERTEIAASRFRVAYKEDHLVHGAVDNGLRFTHVLNPHFRQTTTYQLQHNMTDNYLPIPELLAARRDPPEVDLLLQECASGQLEKVRRIFQGYLIRVAREERNLRDFADVLLTAAEEGRADILSYVLPYWLSAGCPLLPEGLVWGAIDRKSVAVLEVLLDFGWDINEPMSRIAPPAL